MARGGGIDCRRLHVLGAAGGSLGGAAMAAAGDRFSVARSVGDHAPQRALPAQSLRGALCRWCTDDFLDWISGVFGAGTAFAPRAARCASAFRGGTVAHKYSGIRAVVLAAGRRRPACASARDGADQKRFFVSADDAASHGCGRRVVVSAFCRLFISGVQYQHGVFADGYVGAIARSEVGNDGAVADFAADFGAASGAGGEHFVSSGETVALSRMAPRDRNGRAVSSKRRGGSWKSAFAA